jgi:hypothetical protein
MNGVNARRMSTWFGRVNPFAHFCPNRRPWKCYVNPSPETIGEAAGTSRVKVVICAKA